MIKKAVLLVFVGILTLLSGCGTHSRKDASSAAPSTVQDASTQPAPRPDRTAKGTAPSQEEEQPVASLQTREQQVQTAEQAKAEKALQSFLSLADPTPPVAADKIEGVWWSEDNVKVGVEVRKGYGFVENMKPSGNSYLLVISTQDKTKVIAECFETHPALKHTIDDVEDCNYPPPRLFTWSRMAFGNVITNPTGDFWSLTFRNDDSSAVIFFLVKYVCYPEGACRSYNKEGEEELQKLVEKRRRGKE